MKYELHLRCDFFVDARDIRLASSQRRRLLTAKFFVLQESTEWCRTVDLLRVATVDVQVDIFTCFQAFTRSFATENGQNSNDDTTTLPGAVDTLNLLGFKMQGLHEGMRIPVWPHCSRWYFWFVPRTKILDQLLILCCSSKTSVN